MVEEPPVAGSVMVMLCGPSPFARAATIICAALTASTVAAVLPTLAVRPGAKPVPDTVTAPPLTPMREGETESA